MALMYPTTAFIQDSSLLPLKCVMCENKITLLLKLKMSCKVYLMLSSLFAYQWMDGKWFYLLLYSKALRTVSRSPPQ